MARFCAIPRASVVVAGPPLRSQLRVGRADTLRCHYSKQGLKACSSANLSPAVLKGTGLRRVWRPWGSHLVEEQQMEPQHMRLLRLSRVLNPEWLLACVVGYILFNPERILRRMYDDNDKSDGSQH